MVYFIGDERNKSMLIDMLKTFVDIPDKEYELTFLDTNLKPEFEDDKRGIHKPCNQPDNYRESSGRRPYNYFGRR